MKIDTKTISDNFGSLKAVNSLIYCFEDESGEMESAVELVFENGHVFHESLDNDEITCESQLRNEYQRIKDISMEAPWKHAIGRSIRWLWKLTNQQGYNDAIQYEFAHPEEKGIIIQLVVEATELKIYELRNL